MQWVRGRVGVFENLIQLLSVCEPEIPNIDENTFLLLLPYLRKLLPLDHPLLPLDYAPAVGQVKTSTLRLLINNGSS